MPRQPRTPQRKQEQKPPMVDPNAPPNPKSFTAEEVEKLVAQASSKATNDLLAKLGAKTPDEISEVLGRFRQNEEAQKSELQKLVEFKTKAEQELASANAYRERFGAMLSKQIEGLSPERKAALTALAGDEPLKLAQALDVLGPTWATPPAETPKGEPPKTETGPANAKPNLAPPPPAAKPASASMPVGAPPPAGVRTKWEEYAAIPDSIAKDLFYSVNSKEIEASRPN